MRTWNLLQTKDFLWSLPVDEPSLWWFYSLRIRSPKIPKLHFPNEWVLSVVFITVRFSKQHFLQNSFARSPPQQLLEQNFQPNPFYRKQLFSILLLQYSVKRFRFPASELPVLCRKNIEVLPLHPVPLYFGPSVINGCRKAVCILSHWHVSSSIA